jgi:hypothetical protein
VVGCCAVLKSAIYLYLLPNRLKKSTLYVIFVLSIVRGAWLVFGENRVLPRVSLYPQCHMHITLLYLTSAHSTFDQLILTHDHTDHFGIFLSFSIGPFVCLRYHILHLCVYLRYN